MTKSADLGRFEMPPTSIFTSSADTGPERLTLKSPVVSSRTVSTE